MEAAFYRNSAKLTHFTSRWKRLSRTLAILLRKVQRLSRAKHTMWKLDYWSSYVIAIIFTRGSAVAERPRDALSDEILPTAAQPHEKSHSKRLSIQWYRRSLKVIRNITISYAIYHFLLWSFYLSALHRFRDTTTSTVYVTACWEVHQFIRNSELVLEITTLGDERRNTS